MRSLNLFVNQSATFGRKATAVAALAAMLTFGVEPIENQGAIYSNIGDVVVKGKVETEVGNWGLLFQNLYEAIAEGKELLIKPELVLEQIKIIEAVKQL